MKRLWMAAAAGCWIAPAPASAAEWPTHRMRPQPLCGIPNYPYQAANAIPRPTVTSASLIRVTAVGATVPGVVPDSPRSDLLPPPIGLGGPVIGAARSPVVFQLADPRLQLDHCFLSRVAVTVYEDGRYLVNFRADQNPQPVRDTGSPLKPGERVETILQTSQLRRNQFVVHVRGYALAPVRQDLPGIGIGKPVLFDLPVPSFMVQRGEPYYGKFEGRSEAVRRSFELIDRVEVDFTYR